MIQNIIASISVFLFPPPATIKTNALLMAADQYLHTYQVVEGTVANIGPAGSFFVLEDNTGQLMITTEKSAKAFGCALNSKIKIAGTLQKIEIKQVSYYLSMNRLVDCFSPAN